MSNHTVLSMAEKEALVCPSCGIASAYHCADCIEESREMACDDANRMPCADDTTPAECEACRARHA